MGAPTSPKGDPVPTYESLYNSHPVHQHPPSGSSSAYAPVSQFDEPEPEPDHAHDQVTDHIHLESQTPAQPGETLLQTLVAPFRAKPHVHCEACDAQQERKDRQQNERHCCTLVAATFMVAFVCLLLLAIVITRSHVVGKHGGKDKRWEGVFR